MVTPPAPVGRRSSSPTRDLRLDAAIERLIGEHGLALRRGLAALAEHRPHLTAGHGEPLAAAFERLEAVVGAYLARELRVIAPYLRALAAGTPDRTVFASIAEPWPVVVSEQRACDGAVAALLAVLASSPCPRCAPVVAGAHDLISALAAHREFTDRTLYPLALARERAQARPPPD